MLVKTCQVLDNTCHKQWQSVRERLRYEIGVIGVRAVPASMAQLIYSTLAL
jgi:hypothetical protein